MADAKISALTDGTTPQDADQFAAARSTSDVKLTWSELRTALPGYQLDYVQITSPVSITATSDATANAIIDGNAVTYDGSTRIKIEFFTPDITVPVGNAITVVLNDGSTDLGRLGTTANHTSSSNDQAFYAAAFLTPSAAAHTYHIKAWIFSSATGTIGTGVGGAGVNLPAWYRITKA